jgi:copper resistance protein D
LITPDIAYQACRFLHDTALMLLWGSFAFLSLLTPNRLAHHLRPQFDRFLLAATAIVAATIAVALPLQAGTIGDGWSDVTNLSTIGEILFHTTVGRAWQAQLGAFLFLCIALLLPWARRPAAVTLASGLNLAALALIGHAAMNEGLLGMLHRTNDIVHVLAAGGWLGALLPLLPILKLLRTDAYRRDATTALRRFSTFGHAAVALVILSGAVNTALILRRLPTDWSSPYQRLLVIKIAIVIGMTMLAVVNRYVFVPQMRRRREKAADAIRIGSMAEIALGVAAIACVAVFGMLEPV